MSRKVTEQDFNNLSTPQKVEFVIQSISESGFWRAFNVDQNYGVRCIYCGAEHLEEREGVPLYTPDHYSKKINHKAECVYSMAVDLTTENKYWTVSD